MKSRLKEWLLRVWDMLVRFALWCEKHGVPEMLVEAVLNVFIWWLTRQLG